MDALTYWEDRYAGGPSRWSGNPNPGLVAEADGLPPGTALELGCGQGDDAIWLARQGWTVTAVDVSLHSPVELARTQVLRRASEHVAPGGTLLVIGHAPSAEHRHADLQTADEVVADLALPEDVWRLVGCAQRSFQHAFHGEDAHERTDAVVRYERIS